jgi:coproporphyrinogen III oxidase
MLKKPPENSREKTKNLLLELQDKICKGLERTDGEGKFIEEAWEREEGGGGRSRVLKNGKIFEQAGVNFSEVHGKELPQSIISQRPEAKGHKWFATGTSMVLHPKNPFIPTVHLNYRYFEAGPVWWFGGGADLTPFYPYLNDVRHFHKEHKIACEKVHKDLHKVFKPWCDEYFFLKHRNESRGIGGIFYDYQDGSSTVYKGNNQKGKAFQKSTEIGELNLNWDDLFALALNCGQAFLPAYLPIVEKRVNHKYSTKEREFQLYRRGRYVEFNLVWDRGTIFGLQTNGRTESILMSLPPLARWEYGFQAKKGSREEFLTSIFTKPQDWQNDKKLEEFCFKNNIFD